MQRKNNIVLSFMASWQRSKGRLANITNADLGSLLTQTVFSLLKVRTST